MHQPDEAAAAPAGSAARPARSRSTRGRVRTTSEIGIDSPSTVKATISPRLPMAECEPLDLALVRRAGVADHDPGEEHGQEAGPVGERGHAVQQEREGDGPQRVQRLVGQRDVPEQPAQGRGRRPRRTRCRPPSAAGTRRPRARPRRQPAAAGAAGSPASTRCRPGRWRRTRPRAGSRCGPTTSRRPSTEKTTAGSVGASAVPTSSAARQSKSKSMCASTARPPR